MNNQVTFLAIIAIGSAVNHYRSGPSIQTVDPVNDTAGTPAIAKVPQPARRPPQSLSLGRVAGVL